jgi:hypothetical protein
MAHLLLYGVPWLPVQWWTYMVYYMHVKQVQYVEAQENNPSLIIISVTIKLYM